MRILSVGPFSSHNRNNTTVHRGKWLKKYSSYYKEIDTSVQWSLWTRIIYKLSCWGIRFNIPDEACINKKLLREVQKNEYDIIWIDKGNVIYPQTLREIKEIQPKCLLVHYMIDDFMNPYHKTKQIIDTIPLYDYYIINRQVNIEELKQYGCKHPICVFMSYENTFHYPREITETEKKELGGDIGFIGWYEKERAQSILYLTNRGLKVRVWGDGWQHLKDKHSNLLIENIGLFDDNYCKALRAFKINLGFLRKKSRDLHTTRSTEIPACGGFMLAERTMEHQMLFEEDKEAVFFSSNEELLEKCKYYLEHEEERKAIAEAGWRKCQTAGYSNEETIRKMLQCLVKV